MTKVSPESDGVMAVKAAVACLRSGGVALLPTDTVYGLATSPENDEAVRQIYELKRRPRERNLPIMVAASFDLSTIGIQQTPAAMRLLASPFVPGPLTLALGIDRDRAPRWLSGRDEVAIRIPKSKFMLDVLEQTGPLLVTSANVHGQPTAHCVAEIVKGLNGSPDLAIDGGQLSDVPSTLVNCRKEPPVIERVGAIPADEILEYLG